MIWLILVFYFIFGACVGSFLNVVTLRLPEGKSLSGRSHCPKCHKTLKAWELIPVISYIFLRGKCSQCKKPIHRRYVYVEILCGLLTAMIYSFFPAFNLYTWIFLIRALIIVYVLLTVFIIDYEHFLILDSVIIFGSGSLIILNAALDYISGGYKLHSTLILGILSGVALAVFFFLQYWISKGKWIGMGDIKFAIFLGLAVPFPSILITLILAYFIGAAAGILLILFKGAKLKTEVPFGTFLSLACLVSLCYGQQLTHWYLHIIGLVH